MILYSMDLYVVCFPCSYFFIYLPPQFIALCLSVPHTILYKCIYISFEMLELKTLEVFSYNKFINNMISSIYY